ncbi:MAG: hypothetical protein NC350_03455 [Corallococcus sp.]|nr:hypothetical protein [Corallococcus sp.]
MPALIIGVIVFIVIIVIFTAVARAKATVSKSSGESHSQKDVFEAYKSKRNAERSKNSVSDVRRGITVEGDGHSHTSDEVEHYDKIIGSLGDVSDEGCSELDGLRLIVHDEAYSSDDQTPYDLSKVGQTIILGEIFGTPRGKQNYKYKR